MSVTGRNRRQIGTANPFRSFVQSENSGAFNLNDSKRKKDRPPPAVFSENPSAEIEERLRANPKDCEAKIDAGSDESMDASDPPSVVQPEHDEPVPSSGFDDEDDKG